jgi:hypothetical protein
MSIESRGERAEGRDKRAKYLQVKFFTGKD